jgi:hypothetical protein
MYKKGVRMKEINNPTARIWTNAQLKETVQQSRQAKLLVEKKTGGFTTITDPLNGNVVLRSLQTGPGVNMVRYDQSYFAGSRKIAYVYIDKNGLVCYCCDQDNEHNRQNSGWQRFEVAEKYLQAFFHYYELRFHPLTKSVR